MPRDGACWQNVGGTAALLGKSEPSAVLRMEWLRSIVQGTGRQCESFARVCGCECTVWLRSTAAEGVTTGALDRWMRAATDVVKGPLRQIHDGVRKSSWLAGLRRQWARSHRGAGETLAVCAEQTRNERAHDVSSCG